MNRAASYTFGHRNSYGVNGTSSNDAVSTPSRGTRGESIADQIWELLLDSILEKYTQHSILALTKTIHLVQHVLLHGSEPSVTDGELLYRLEMAVSPLRNLNTALVEQELVERILNGGCDSGDFGGQNSFNFVASLSTRASATLIKLRGGSVDRGHPVRVAATRLYGICADRETLRRMRMQQQSGGGSNAAQGSLVPIGSSNQVGFITDEARYRLLQEKVAKEEQALRAKKMKEEQRLNATRSNLKGASATDAFGGGFASVSDNPSGANPSGRAVVGAAHSLEDMIQSARRELEQSKLKRRNQIASLRKGYSDDPVARAREVQEMERRGWETDPKVMEKEKALKEALEYLEEMQRLENEGAQDLLGRDDGGGDGGDGLWGVDASSDEGGGNAPDLLGFDDFSSKMDGYGASLTLPSNATLPSGTISSGGGGTVDLLDFDVFGSGGGNTNSGTSSSALNANSLGLDSRISLVTGTGNAGTGAATINNNNYTNTNSSDLLGISNGGNTYPTRGGNASSIGPIGGHAVSPVNTPYSEQDEEAKADHDRKMKMAQGLFAGVVPVNNNTNNSSGNSHANKTPIMGSNQNRASAFDDLIPVSETPFTVITSPAVFGGVIDQNRNESTTDEDPFAMGPMGGNAESKNAVIPLPPSVPPPPPPSMAPPPPPTEPPPPPPPVAGNIPFSGLANTNANNRNINDNNPYYPSNFNNSFGNNNVSNMTPEQMMQIMMQQQQQMEQMMKMMQGMGMQSPSLQSSFPQQPFSGVNNNNNANKSNDNGNNQTGIPPLHDGSNGLNR